MLHLQCRRLSLLMGYDDDIITEIARVVVNGTAER